MQVQSSIIWFFVVVVAVLENAFTENTIMQNKINVYSSIEHANEKWSVPKQVPTENLQT